MALATRCPHCSALFRVGAEQLRSHNGMVRCGSCRKVFNAIGRLDYVEPSALQPEPAAARPPAPAAPPAPARARTAPPPAAAAPAPSAPQAPPRPPAPAVRQAPAPVPVGGPPTLFDADIPAGLLAAHRAPALPQDVDDAEAPGPMVLSSGPPTGPGEDDKAAPSFDDVFADAPDTQAPQEDDAETLAAPTFLREAPAGRERALRRAYGAASALLVILLAIQAVLLFRADLLARVPELRPVLAALCAPLSCNTQWPMRPEFLTVMSSEMHSIPGTPALELVSVVRSRADIPLALPAIELRLTDTQDHTVGQKVFLPEAYLANSPPDARLENIGAGADLSVRLLFEFPGTNVAGFETYPFYP